MKVLFTKSFFKSDIDYLSERLSDGIELITPPDFEPETLVEAARDADVLFGGTFSDAMLSGAKNLKFAQIPWTGVDNLDFELLKKHNVTVSNSHSNAIIVAEHGVALMLDAAKKISYHDRQMRAGEWNRVKPEGNAVSPFSKMIVNSKVALVGFGAIGKEIYKILSGFGCEFKIFTRSGKPVSGFETAQYFQTADIYPQLNNVDFVFLALPLTPESKNVVDAKFLAAMNDNSVLINLSRGELINEDDLFAALKGKKIGAAAIDVWYNYPNAQNPTTFPSLRNNFHELDNITLSPHRAGYADAGFLHLDDAIENLNNYKTGKPLKNVISLNDKY